VSPPRFRRARGIRAFADKDGGWTLLARTGEAFALRNAASLALWEALAEGGDLETLTDRLARLFPRAERAVLRRDAARFVRSLVARRFAAPVD